MAVMKLNKIWDCRRRTYIVIAVIMFGVFVILYQTIGFYYAMNDDMTLQQITSGYYDGVPNGHLAGFSRFFYGSIIAVLFRVMPMFDWYGLAFLGLVFLCYVILMCRIFRMTEALYNKRIVRVSCAMLLIILFFESTVLFQFTVVAGTLAATALFILISVKTSEDKGILILAWMLLLAAGMIRIMIFFMILPLFGGVFLIKAWGLNCRSRQDHMEHKGRCLPKINITYVVIGCVAIVVYLGISLLEKYAYSDATWRSYAQYNHARSLIMDYYGWPAYEGNEGFWEEIEVSPEEHACLGMFGILPDIDADKIEKIAAYSKKIQQEKMPIQQLAGNMAELFLKAVKSEKSRTQNISMLIMLFLLVLCTHKTERRQKLLICAGVMIQMSILAYLLYRGRLPDRIIIPYDCQCALGILAVLLNQMNERQDLHEKAGWPIGHMLLGMIGLILSIVAIGNAVDAVNQYKVQLAVYGEFKEYMLENPQKIYITSSGTINTKKEFSVLDDKEHVNWFGSYGWSSKSPWYEARMFDLGLDTTGDILLTGNVYFLTADLARADALNTYYKSEGKIQEDYMVAGFLVLSNGICVYVVHWGRIEN